MPAEGGYGSKWIADGLEVQRGQDDQDQAEHNERVDEFLTHSVSFHRVANQRLARMGFPSYLSTVIPLSMILFYDQALSKTIVQTPIFMMKKPEETGLR